LKIDLLGLGMLSAVERCVEEIARARGERIDLSRIPYDDRRVYEEIQRAETMGVFQTESRAQMQMLPRTRPAALVDLTVPVARGASLEVARRVYSQIVGFSGFGFPKAHSAAFGLLAYQSTWLRVYYGPELLCSLLNEQPMGFYPPDSLVHEAQRRGIPVLPPCILA